MSLDILQKLRSSGLMGGMQRIIVDRQFIIMVKFINLSDTGPNPGLTIY
jgi:hypothetical protein